MKQKQKDFSNICTMDDEHDEHCWYCSQFVFPIGCMKLEEEEEEEDTAVDGEEK